ncbi:general transcription repressor, partial [Spiromyces aspiralis]
MVAAAPVSSRILELLDALRAECEKLSQDASAMKVHHDEYEQRLSSQASEMQAFQQSLHDLERTHQRIKAQYEEEIMRLRRELEARGGPQVPPGPFLPSAGSAHANGPQSYGMGPPPHVVNPAHPHSGSATASSSVPGQNGANGAPTQQPGAVPPPHPDHPSYGGAVPPQSGPPPSSMYGSHTGMPTPRQHITTPQISSQPLASGKPGASRHDEPPPHPLGGATSQPPPAHSIPPQQHNPPIPPPPQVAGEPGPTGPSHAVQKSSVDAHLATTSFSSPAFANQVSLRVTQALEHDSVVCCVRF